MTDQLARARADLASGRAWKARDRLHGLLCNRQDDEVLDLLATVHHAMLDLPAAGALWFVTGRRDATTTPALAAWHERRGGPEARWRSIPAPVRRGRDTPELRALEGEAARQAGRGGEGRVLGAAPAGAWWEPVVFGGGVVLFLVWLVTMLCVGFVTTLRWIWS